VTPRLVYARSAIRLGLTLGLLVVLLLPALVVRADALDDGVRRIAMQLQCPVCEGENAADSPSGLAADMRAVIRTKLIAGERDQQILDEFVASYGDSILTEPPKRGISLGVWLGPSIGVVLGAVLLGSLLRSWRRRPNATTRALAGASVDAEVTEEYRRFREEFGR
jgi:cytochrome c-type biogenesis protein CcmH